jgi:uncharacterized FlgJ-related protein
MIYKFNKNLLKYENITPKAIGIIISLTLIITSTLSFITLMNVNDVKLISAETKSIILRDNDVFTRDKLKNYLEQLNVKYPDIVMAQAEHESGNFTSKLFRENNNMFGMKISTSRPTTQNGEQNGYAYYNTWRESVLDYAMYSATYLNKIQSKAEYLQYLGEHYAEDTLYVRKIKKVID